MKVLSKACEDASVTERNLSVSELMVIAAKEMLGTPYVAGTLEEDPLKEQLRIYLTKTDCILFVETCLNLARTVKDGSTAFDLSASVVIYFCPSETWQESMAESAMNRVIILLMALN